MVQRRGKREAKNCIDVVISGSVRFVGYMGEGLANERRSVHKTSSGCLRLKLLSVTYIRVFVLLA